MAQQSILDARLAEIDRRLRTIQSGLAQGGEPAASAVGAEAAASDVSVPDASGATRPSRLADELDEARRLVAGLQELTAAHQRLLTSSRELLSTFSETLAGSGPGAPPALGLAAGPFADTAALRRFSEGLEALPEVRAVTVREYTGADRVIIDVHLWGPTS